jgi:hypothetical protein
VTIAITFQPTDAALEGARAWQKVWDLSSGVDPRLAPSGNALVVYPETWRQPIIPENVNAQDPYAVPSLDSGSNQPPGPGFVPQKLVESNPLGLTTIPKDIPIQEELTGDLHMRQGDYAKAAEMFEQVLKHNPDHPRHVEHLKKLVQACVGQGDADSLAHAKELLEEVDKARQAEAERIKSAVQKGIDFLVTSQAQAQLTAGPATRHSPARLTVSATVSALKAVQEGTLSQEDFAQAVQVRFADPAAEDAAVKEDSEKADQSRGEPSAGALLGHVLAVQEDGLAEISLGLDDGLKRGEKVRFVRDKEYVGEGEIVRLNASAAVVRVTGALKPLKVKDQVQIAMRP